MKTALLTVTILIVLLPSSYASSNSIIKMETPCEYVCLNHSSFSSINHGFFIGSNSRKFYDSYGNKVNYSGASLGYKITFNDYLFVNIEHSKGQAYRLKEDSVNIRSLDLGDLNYKSNQLTAFISSNTGQGWKVFGGLGAFRDKVRDRSFPASGKRPEGRLAALGFGYRYTNIEARFTYSTYNSGGYNSQAFTGHAFKSEEYYSDPVLGTEKFGKIRSDSANIQLGYIF